MSYFEGIEVSSVLLFYLYAFLLTVLLFFIRFLSIRITKPNIDKNGMLVLLSMVPKGLAAAVLISFYVNNVSMTEYESQKLIFTTYGVILISIFASSILVFIVERRIKNNLSLKDQEQDEENVENFIEDENSNNQSNL